MFLFGRKLDPTLKHAVSCSLYNNYRVIIQYKSLKESIEKKVKSLRGKVLFSIPSIKCIIVTINGKSIKRLIELPEVRFIALDDFAQLCGRTILPANGISLQSDSTILKGEYNLTGKGVGIGLVDSGVFPHVDLLNPRNKIKKFIDLINGLVYPYDDNGHGTFIAGELCGSGYGSKDKNKGISINSHIVMVKAFDKLGRGYISTTLLALQEIYNNADEFNIKVLCLPFETFSMTNFILSLYNQIFKMLKAKNIAIIVPAGHNGASEDTIKGIATSNNVIAVGGMDTSSVYKIADYSSCGSSKVLQKPDFIAASENIVSLHCDTSYVSERNGMKIYPPHLSSLYTEYSGTSTSCAFIAGVCALLFENNMDYKFDDIYGLLKHSSSLINEMKYKQGNGYINLDKILPPKAK
jgi:serine protease AprX